MIFFKKLHYNIELFSVLNNHKMHLKSVDKSITRYLKKLLILYIRL